MQGRNAVRRRVLVLFLEWQGHRVWFSSCGKEKEAAQKIRSSRFVRDLLDLDLP
jgi:CheY-like chemotaxis protein